MWGFFSGLHFYFSSSGRTIVFLLNSRSAAVHVGRNTVGRGQPSAIQAHPLIPQWCTSMDCAQTSCFLPSMLSCLLSKVTLFFSNFPPHETLKVLFMLTWCFSSLKLVRISNWAKELQAANFCTMIFFIGYFIQVVSCLWHTNVMAAHVALYCNFKENLQHEDQQNPLSFRTYCGSLLDSNPLMETIWPNMTRITRCCLFN